MFRDFDVVSSSGRAQAPPSCGFQQTTKLIDRYPNLSEVELARLINLYRELPALDVALMLSDEKIAPRLDRFFVDHRSKIRTPFRQYAALVGLAFVGVAVTIWAVVFGS